MTATELLDYQLRRNHSMLERLLEDFDDKELDLKLTESRRSFREGMTHLSEACFVTAKMGRGEDHKWGNFTSSAADFAGFKSELYSLRADACKAVLVENDAMLHAGFNFLMGHENFHIGQLSSLKQKLHPHWTSFELYS